MVSQCFLVTKTMAGRCTLHIVVSTCNGGTEPSQSYVGVKTCGAKAGYM
jgi:hypothetical protein